MRATHQGFTLLEIMIALTIGLFLMTALITIVQSNKAVFGSQNQLEQMQDGQRMALSLMADVIQSASYFPDPTVNTSGVLVQNNALGFQSLQGITGAFNAAAPGDSVSVRYMTTGGDGILNCSGTSNTTAVGNNILYVNQFQVIAGVPSGQLVCNMTALGVTTAYTLVSGVTNLTVLYGVKTNGSPGNSIDTYLNATQMNANPLNWQNVISVLIKLTFNNPLYTGAGQGQPQFISVQRVVDLMNQTGPAS
jgi:type IV pilus assembly protein PilW